MLVGNGIIYFLLEGGGARGRDAWEEWEGTLHLNPSFIRSDYCRLLQYASKKLVFGGGEERIRVGKRNKKKVGRKMKE